MDDLNADLLQPNAEPGKSLKFILKLADSSVKVIFPSRITLSSQTCLDIIAIPNQLICSVYRVVLLSLSDHFPIEVLIVTAVTVAPSPIRKRSYATINYDHMKRSVSNISIKEDSSGPDHALNHWNSCIMDIIDVVAPIKSFPIIRGGPNQSQSMPT